MGGIKTTSGRIRRRPANEDIAYWATLGVLLVAPTLLIAYKVLVNDYSLAKILPRREYSVTLAMSLDGHNGRARVKTFIPRSDEVQQITETRSSDVSNMQVRVESDQTNRVSIWTGGSVPDETTIEYSFDVLSTGRQYRIAPELQVPEHYSPSLASYLVGSEAVQVDSEEILATLSEIGADQGPILQRLQAIYELTSSFPIRPFKGTTDALTALRLGEASCNGKSRLFVALARAAGIPARLVGGLIMTSGSKRVTHQWVEAYVGGHWVPFGPTNDHFAEVPENYLVLYRGDESLFAHSSDINFDYRYRISTKMVPAPEARTAFGQFNIWALFERLQMPFGLLQTILMLPVGALIVVFFRNVIGMPTYGTFLPALIAAAAKGTGLGWGMLSVLLIIAAVSMARWLMQRLRLLHSPTLAILLTVVVVTMLLSSLAAERLGLGELARVSFYPIAVMAIAAERFYLSLAEKGIHDAIVNLAGTLIVVAACFVVMNSLALQILVSGFPEVLAYVLAANVYLGRWVGLRVFEYRRFRSLLRAEASE